MKKILSTGICLLSVSFSFSSFGDIELARGIRKKEKTAIERDIKLLKSLIPSTKKLSGPKKPSSSLLKVLGIKKFNSKTLYSWLDERVSYIIPAKERWYNAVYFADAYVEYPDEDGDYYSDIYTSTYGSSLEERMENTGAVLYHDGKKEGYLMGISIPLSDGDYDIEVYSPRVGIIKMGKGLFIPEEQPNELNDKAKSNSFGRLATLFHEARHSDGHGSHLSFSHIECPNGHDMEGMRACDNSKNGAYSIGALMLGEFLKHCQGCSREEKMALAFQKSDYENRIQAKKVFDDEPEWVQTYEE